MPAQDTLQVDKYGMPLTEKNITYILNLLEPFKNNRKRYLDELKKNCMSVDDMFKSTLSNECHFNEALLDDVMEDLKWSAKENYEQGNIEYIKGVPYTHPEFIGVEWVKSKQGRWFKRKDFSSNGRSID